MKNKPYGIIYKITNKINGKVYIGQTIRSFNKRYKGDLLNTHNEHLKNSILKYGIDNFEIIKEYDTAQDQEELNQKEEYYINLFNSMDPSKGYNKKGGGSRGKLSEETKKKVSIKSLGVNNGMYGKNHTEETKKKISASIKTKRKVIQLTKEGNYIKTFNSIVEANLYLNKDKNSSNIITCCKGKRPSMYGFKWMYEEDYIKLKQMAI